MNLFSLRFLAVLALAILSGQGFPAGGGVKKSEADRRLEQAFGEYARESKRPIRIWLADKRLLLALGEIAVQKDGRVRIAPFSAAFFKEEKPGAEPDIFSVRCDIANLTLDRPFTQAADLVNRKVIKAELQGRQVLFEYKRGVGEKGHYLGMLATDGSLYYDADQSKVWADGIVRFDDFPARCLRGKGMEMKLSKPRPGTEFGNVEKISLRENVELNLRVDGRSGFWPGAENPMGDAKAPPEKALIRILGDRATCDPAKQTAVFEVASRPKNDELNWRNISVERRQKVDGESKVDQLRCERLELQLHPEGRDLRIKTLKATARSDGEEVVLALDTENTAVYGNYYFFDAGDAKTAAQAIAKGTPLRSSLGGDSLKCKELYFANKGQPTKVVGPGSLDLVDRDIIGGPEKCSKHVRWRDTLVITRTDDGRLRSDLFKASGAASFVDDENRQQIKGEEIEIRLRRGPEIPKKDAAGGGKK